MGRFWLLSLPRAMATQRSKQNFLVAAENAESLAISWCCVGQVTAPVQACGLSADCRHLLAACGNGYIFRFEYARPEPAAPGEPEEGGVSDYADE